jgi:hypothetical protein
MQAGETWTELASPPEMPRLRGRDLLVGLDLLPVQKLAAFSDEQLEMIVSHWLHETVKSRYANVVEYGGAGDKGRDRAGFDGAVGTDPWDNYQCKQYGKKLSPGDLWLEFGKLVYHVSTGAYTCPRNYAFVCPRGFGPSAADLLGKPEAIREGLVEHWDTKCAALCSYDEIKDALGSFPFPTFVPIGGQQIVDDLSGTAIYPRLFGGGLTKPRPLDLSPPDQIADIELPYITQLVDAYGEHAEGRITSVQEALIHGAYGNHLRGSRREFYCAESLREFSKDVMPRDDAFSSLQDEIFDGVRYTVAQAHATGYDRVLATCAQAASVAVGDHPLANDLRQADRAGICHQLANDDRLRWVQ